MSENIPYIHSYCDRWCERCTMTSRCAIYNPNEKGPFEATTEVENQELWDSVAKNLAKAMEIISYEVKKQGIVITEEDNEKITKEPEERNALTDSHELNALSSEYWKKARPVLQSVNMEEFAQKTTKEIELGIKDIEAQEKKLTEIERNFEVLHYYLFFINTKCNRAVSGLLFDTKEGISEDINGIPNDMLGSAKIALIATRRSIGAWALMMQNEIFQDSETLPLLAILQKIEKMILDYFPYVEKYKRPGFDD